MVILTTCFNCDQYITRCIESIKQQSFSDFVCYITDDISTDATISVVKDLIFNDNRFILIENKAKKYQGGNYDQVIRNNDSISDDEVCVELDGDDWFPDELALQRIADVYQKKSVWLANGSFVYQDGRHGFSKKPSFFKSIRAQDFTLSHIRTWRAFLWRKIKETDLIDKNGHFYEVAGDLTFMFPMYEMAWPFHYQFMKDVNYVYNEGNPMNDHKIHMQKVEKIALEIRNKQPYKRL